MNVQMRNGLPCDGTIVDSDVVAARVELAIQAPLCQVKQIEQLMSLIGIELKEATDMTPRDHERVTRRNWKGISDDHAELGAMDNPTLRQCTKRA
jgi:hypothetical protein